MNRQHAITTATKYKNSFVTAIDLSSKSLCYAKEKQISWTKNIEFIEMDILDLKNYSKKFEIIESVGSSSHERANNRLANTIEYLKTAWITNDWSL